MLNHNTIIIIILISLQRANTDNCLLANIYQFICTIYCRVTLPNSDSGCEAALPGGNVEKVCAFTMAWKCCHYISEVNSTNLGTLLDHICFYHLFLSEMLLFFHVEDNEILVEYAYSFLRLIFNTA